MDHSLSVLDIKAIADIVNRQQVRGLMGGGGLTYTSNCGLFSALFMLGDSDRFKGKDTKENDT